MSEYDIKRWDVVMFGTSITKVPMIYIKPDISLLEFIKANNYAVLVKISGTGTQYDGKEITGVVDRSCNVPNCRPNFFEETGYYVVTLNANWIEYPHPSKLGQVMFSGLNKIDDTKMAELILAEKGKTYMNNRIPYIVLIVIMVIFAIFIVFSRFVMPD